MTTLSGRSTAITRGGAAVEILADRVLEALDLERAVRSWRRRSRSQKSRIASGVYAAAAQAGDASACADRPSRSRACSSTSWSSLRLLITVYVRLSRANSYCCGTCRHRDRLDDPVVELAVALELERADRVRDALERVLEAVREVVERVDAPRVAGAVVMRVLDAEDRRVAHLHVGRRHVDLRAQRRARRPRTRPRACGGRGRGSPRRVRSRYGLCFPGSVTVPRYSRISSSFKLADVGAP